MAHRDERGEVAGAREGGGGDEAGTAAGNDAEHDSFLPVEGFALPWGGVPRLNFQKETSGLASVGAMVKCTAEGCDKRAYFGVEHRKPLRCGQHRQTGDDNVKHARCCHEGCKNRPGFGPGDKAIACLLHKESDWKNVFKHVCDMPGCKVTAIFGLRGGRATRCAKHKLSAFVDVKNKRCEYKDCERSPSYGPSGTKKPLTCKVHSEKDWILVTKRYCQQPHCCKIATFGVVGRQPLACADHKLSTHTNVVSKKCFFDGCLKLPTFGPKKTAIACRLHCQAGWKDVVSQMCRQTGCEIHASYGLVKGKALYCSKHRGPTMSTVVGKFCQQESCSVKVYFSYTHCANHDTTQKRQTRVRENQIANLLRDSASIPWTHWNREIEGGRICGKAYRPDFTYDLGTHVLAVEVDEMQHASYECDRSRMVDIFNSCGGAPVTFVRYNPDGFKLAGKKSSADTKTRHELLLREVEKGLAGKQERLLSIVKLFLDNDRDDFVQRSWIDVDDHRFTETSSDNQM